MYDTHTHKHAQTRTHAHTRLQNTIKESRSNGVIICVRRNVKDVSWAKGNHLQGKVLDI